MLVGAFAYLYRDAMPNQVIYLWILPNSAAILICALWLIPVYGRTENNQQDSNRLLRLCIFNIIASNVLWRITLPFLFTTDDPASLAYWLPLIISFSLSIFNGR